MKSPFIGGLAFLAAFVCNPAWAAPQVQKVANPPALTALRLLVGGRASHTHAASQDDLGSDDYTSQWPGSYFEAAFEGTEVYFRIGKAHEILHVVLDKQAPLVLTDPEPGVYRIYSLENKAHTVLVQVATESQGEPNHFGGFGLTAHEQPLMPAKRSRQIEFIGDSHTVGYGNTSSKGECTQGEVWATTDDTQAFGALTAEHYNAEYQVNAISGRGIVRNYNGSPGDPLPVAYPYVLFDKQQPYNDPNWKPQVIVVALGTNDFSTPLNPGEKWKTREELHADYEATYVRFLQSLRAKNPNAHIILWATEKADGEIEAEVRKVEEAMKARGETKIAFIPMEHLSFSGCHSHPSVVDDRTIRDRLIQWIDSNLLSPTGPVLSGW